MAFSRLTLPSLTTSLPPTSSSSSSSSPLTPLSELSAVSTINTSSLGTPATTSDSSGKQYKSYITYPDHPFPPRQLTPPPKSRFVPFFESISKEAVSSSQSPPVFSRRGSLGDDESSPTIDPISLPFSAAVTKQVQRNPIFISRSTFVDTAPKSAPLTGRFFADSPWTSPRLSHANTLSDASSSGLASSHANEVIMSLRHQVNLKSHRLQLAEAEITRLSNAYSVAIEEKTRYSEAFFHARKHIEDLESFIHKNELAVPGLEGEKQPLRLADPSSQPSTNRLQTIPLWQNEVKENGSAMSEFDVNEGAQENKEALADVATAPEPPTEEAFLTVLTRIPDMPAEIIISSLADRFRSPSFDYVRWLNTNGLQLPRSAAKLAPMSWEDRLRLDSMGLEKLGVTDAGERAYILRVFKAIAEGEDPHLHSTFLSSNFSEEQYVTIMREQRIDKHVPHLAGIPWPVRLFVDEEDLRLLNVQKAGARGTIMTVFGGLRKGGPRPDPRPRRGAKKSKRVKQDAAATNKPSDNHSTGNNLPSHKLSGDKKPASGKAMIGRPGPRMANSRDKASFAQGNAHLATNNRNGYSGNNPWYTARV
ncbi:hypothetical protein CPB86DRAFT_873489 [Serendipita vermifera]|nr:hypothetical protein CPB86DRAFT_873489 [Serendipita vermifera]